MAYRILSLSGGGIRGLFQVEYLKRIARELKAPLHTKFDLIAGTSTGAIVATAIACDIDLDRVSRLFSVQGHQVFERKRLSKASFGAVPPKYSSAALKNALVDIFQNGVERHCNVPVLVSSVRLDTYRKDVHVMDGHSPITDSAINAVMSSCAAPYYFPCHSPHATAGFYDPVFKVLGRLFGFKDREARLYQQRTRT